MHLAIAESDKHIIGCWHEYVDGKRNFIGFFSDFIATLNNIAWAERVGKIPVVHWNHISSYYQPQGYNGVRNVWEYYFEPVSHEQYDPACDPAPSSGYNAPDGSGLMPVRLPSLAVKNQMHALMEKYVRIKKPIQEKIDAFYDAHMAGKKVIGIHLRGTDKGNETEMVGAMDYINAARKIAEKYDGDCLFFVATDEEKLLEKAKREFKEKIVYHNSYRSSDSMPVHFYTHAYSPAKKGEEILIETVLLSRCDAIIHGHSNVAYVATFFNPALETVFIEPKRFVIGQVLRQIDNNNMQNFERFDLFTSLFSVLAHAKWCTEHNRIPIAYWDDTSPYYSKEHGPNAWDYFFEPLNDVKCQEEDSTYHMRTALDGFIIKTNIRHDNAYRAMVHELIKKHAHVRPAILARVKSIYASITENKPLIGIHLAQRNEYALKQATPGALIKAANEAAAEFGECCFFLVADNQELITLAEQHLSNHAIFMIPYLSNAAPAQQGMRLLTEALMLARCDILVHTHANLAYAATFFNPALKTVFLERPS